MHDNSHESSGESRRAFLKKAGAVAWVVPTMQIVNMASASAVQIDGSVVDTTKPPGSTTTTSSTTTTTTTTTTEPPGCKETRICTIKADWDGKYYWSDGSLGSKACVPESDNKCNGGDQGAKVSGDERSVTVTVPEHCTILKAAHKSGSDQDGRDYCVSAEFKGNTATFNADWDPDKKDISNIQLLVECCVEDQ